MSQAAVERRRKILAFTAGAALTVVSFHHVNAVQGWRAKLLYSLGYSSAIAVGSGASKAFKTGAAAAGTALLFRSAYQAAHPQPGPPAFSFGLNPTGQAAQNTVRNNGNRMWDARKNLRWLLK